MRLLNLLKTVEFTEFGDYYHYKMTFSLHKCCITADNGDTNAVWLGAEWLLMQYGTAIDGVEYRSDEPAPLLLSVDAVICGM